MEILLILSAGLAFILGWLWLAALKREEALKKTIVGYDQFFTDVQEGLEYVLSEIRTVDIRGSFEADDEVGIVFKAIKQMIETLKVFQPEGEDAASKE